MKKDNLQVWLVGAKGMLGQEVASQLSEAKISYHATDVDCDITNYEAVTTYLKDKHITHIINCAAYTAVDKAEDEEERAYTLNAIGPKQLALAAKANDIILIHISTDYVFDGKKESGYNESDLVNPISAYGRTKAFGEQYIQEITDKFYIIRTAWLYGKYGNNFVYTMLRLMNERESLTVVNDQHGSPTHAEDLATFIISLVISTEAYGIYHYTNKGQITWYDFACEIYDLGKDKGLINSSCDIKPVGSSSYPTKASRPYYSYLLNSKGNESLYANWQDSLRDFVVSVSNR